MVCKSVVIGPRIAIPQWPATCQPIIAAAGTNVYAYNAVDLMELVVSQFGDCKLKNYISNDYSIPMLCHILDENFGELASRRID